jgi:hypothetical protein
MTTVQILTVLTPVAAFAFMGAIALFERRYDRAPAGVPTSAGSRKLVVLATAPEVLKALGLSGLAKFKEEAASGDDEDAKGTVRLSDETASFQSTDVPEAILKRGARRFVHLTVEEFIELSSLADQEVADTASEKNTEASDKLPNRIRAKK